MADYDGLVRDYRRATTPDAERLARVRRGMRPRKPILGPVLVVIGLAANALVWLRPSPTDLDLSTGEVAVGEYVRLDANGGGAAEREGDTIGIDWEFGTLDVEVEPDRGVDLTVRTDEGAVRVIGTGFTVERDARGTNVTVRHGRVLTDCAFGGPTTLTAGQSRTCLPRTATGALGRIRALEDGGASPETLLTEAEDALARPDATGAPANELGAVRVSALLALGRRAEALEAAESTLVQHPGARDLELHRVAARLANGCPAALPHLRALADAGQLGDDAPAFNHCSPEAP